MEAAREILAALPPFVTPVGLFVDAAADEIRCVADALGLRHIQLHGHEPPATVAALRDRVVLKAVRVNAGLPAELAEWREAIRNDDLTNLRGLVLETAGRGIGGTGIENDWHLV